MPQFNDRETAHVLAALRFTLRMPDRSLILDPGEECDLLDAEEIDDLCERINVVEDSKPSITITIKPTGDIEIDGAGEDVRIVDERTT